jgi:2'-5' RNA ligase
VRLFIAIAPPPAVLDDLESRLAPLRAAWPALRWTGRPAWHLTLAFLGEVADDAAAGGGPPPGRAPPPPPRRVETAGVLAAFLVSIAVVVFLMDLL